MHKSGGGGGGGGREREREREKERERERERKRERKEGVSRGSTPPLSMNVSLSSLHEVQHEYHIWITCYYYYSILATPPPYFEIFESIPLSPVTHRFSSIGISLQKPLTTMDK